MRITRRSTEVYTWTIEETLLERVIDSSVNELEVVNARGESYFYSPEKVLDIWFNSSEPAMSKTGVPVRIVEFPGVKRRRDGGYTLTDEQKSFLKRMAM